MSDDDPLYLEPRLEPRTAALLDSAQLLHTLVDALCSPLNVLLPDQIADNVRRFRSVLDRHRLAGRIYFAHKANRAGSLVRRLTTTEAALDAARSASCGTLSGPGPGSPDPGSWRPVPRTRRSCGSPRAAERASTPTVPASWSRRRASSAPTDFRASCPAAPVRFRDVRNQNALAAEPLRYAGEVPAPPSRCPGTPPGRAGTGRCRLPPRHHESRREGDGARRVSPGHGGAVDPWFAAARHRHRRRPRRQLPGARGPVGALHHRADPPSWAAARP